MRRIPPPPVVEVPLDLPLKICPPPSRRLSP
jgi:hypothetical protein